MAKSRLVLHPMLVNKRSRFIFLIFLCVSGAVGVLCWMKLNSTIMQTGIPISFGPPSNNFLLSMLLTPFFRGGLIFSTAVFVSAITAHLVVGPVRRIEQWMLDAEKGNPLNPLRVRSGDKFTRLVELINRIFQPIEKN